MEQKIAYWGSILCSLAAFALLAVNISLVASNRDLQTEVSNRQATINAGQSYSQLNQGLVQALAQASLKNNDMPIHDLLASQGITIKPNAPTSSSNAPTVKK